jgi:DnaJ-class molecular chaperone
MQPRDPTRQRTPEDDPAPGAPGTGEDICPECHGRGKLTDPQTGAVMDAPCPRCAGTGRIIEGIGGG